MRSWRFVTVISILVFMVLLITACNPFAGNQSQSQQQVQVTRGDLVIKANGSGKVGVDVDAKPSFGVGGKVIKLNVKEGDKIAKGAVLAQLETNILELALSQAKVAESQAQLALTQAKSSQTQAETSLAAAQLNLDKTQAVADIKDAMMTDQWNIKAAQVNMGQALATGEVSAANYLNQYIGSNQMDIAQQQKKLNTLLGKDQYSSDPAGVAYYQALVAQQYDRLIIQDVRVKQLAVDNAQQAIDQAKQNIELAQRTLDQALKSAAVAQKQLTDATITSPIIGTAVTVNIKEGDMIPSPGLSTIVPIYLIDPTTIQVSTQIDEIDVAGVKLGQKAIISLDSAPNTPYQGKVNSISLAPVANPQNSGVVVYEVKVVFSSPPPPEVKLGMSATVDIITNERTGVITVPNRAIKEDSAGKTSVDVLVSQKTESRPVQLGISDGINTEIVSGLKAGDMVIINKSNSNTSLFGQ
jgi:RND family efflux transporter MFP subunit